MNIVYICLNNVMGISYFLMYVYKTSWCGIPSYESHLKDIFLIHHRNSLDSWKERKLLLCKFQGLQGIKKEGQMIHLKSTYWGNILRRWLHSQQSERVCSKCRRVWGHHIEDVCSKATRRIWVQHGEGVLQGQRKDLRSMQYKECVLLMQVTLSNDWGEKECNHALLIVPNSPVQTHGRGDIPHVGIEHLLIRILNERIVLEDRRIPRMLPGFQVREDGWGDAFVDRWNDLDRDEKQEK